MKLKQIVAMLMAAGVVSAPTLVLAAGAADLSSCCTPGDKDYPKAGGNLGNQNYSSLDADQQVEHQEAGPGVDDARVGGTRHDARPSPGTDDGGQQTTPIAVDGVIYMDTPVGDVIAVDGATGAVKWKWHPTAFDTSRQRSPRRLGGRRQGLHARRRQPWSCALNKDTGAQVWVNAADAIPPASRSATSRRSRRSTTTAWSTSAPTTATAIRSSRCARATGSMVWFVLRRRSRSRARVVTDVNGDTIDAGATWGPLQPDGQSCAMTAGATPWIHGAIDPELGMIDRRRSATCAAAARRRMAQLRPGDNLFANSLVALDAEDRRVQVALPVDPPRRMGHGQHPFAGAGRRERRRPDAQGRLLRQQVGPHLHASIAPTASR